MKRLLVGGLSLVLLLVIVVVTVPFLIPAETYKNLALWEISAKTGRSVEIAGDITFKILPDPYIKIEGIAIGNPKGFSGKLLQAKELELGVKLMPLFDRKLEMTRIRLVSPKIELVETASVNNWDFDGSSGEKHEATGLAALYIGKVEIKDGALKYTARDGAKTSVSAINLSIDAGNLKGKASAKGNLEYNKQKIVADVAIASLEQLVGGGRSGVAAHLEYAGAQADFKGEASSKGNQLAAVGKLNVTAPDISQVISQIKSVALSGDMKFKKNGNAIKFSMQEAVGDVDGLKLRGNFSGDTSGKKPKVEADLAFGEVNLNRFLPKEQEESKAESKSPIAWSSEKIDLSALDVMDADIKINADRLLFRKLEINKFAATAELAGGYLEFRIPQTAVFNGKVSATGKASASGNFALNFDASGVQAEPFLRTFADYKRLSGNMDSTINLTANGLSEKAIIGGLGGKGNFQFTDGAIKGRNIAAMLRNVKSAFVETPTTEQKTDFSELRGSFQIASGVVHNSDLMLKSPLIRVGGAGEVNLPSTQVKYRLTPELVASLEGQGATQDITGIKVPIIIEGDLNNPTWRPDLKSVVEEAIRNPEQVQKTVDRVKNLNAKDAKKEAEKLLGDFLGR